MNNELYPIIASFQSLWSSWYERIYSHTDSGFSSLFYPQLISISIVHIIQISLALFVFHLLYSDAFSSSRHPNLLVVSSCVSFTHLICQFCCCCCCMCSSFNPIPSLLRSFFLAPLQTYLYLSWFSSSPSFSLSAWACRVFLGRNQCKSCANLVLFFLRSATYFGSLCL